MKRTSHRIATLALPFCAACAGHAEWHRDEAIAANSIELQLDDTGRMVEIEYHAEPEEVPAAVRASMDALHPGGRTTGAEKEYHGDALYWELTKQIDGLAVEAMFHPDGTLHAEEEQILFTAVPAAVARAASERMEGRIDTWEVIRNGEREVTSYHAKLESGGRRYKLSISPAGEVTKVVREVPAEIELEVHAD